MTDVKVEQCDRDAAANAVQAYRDQKNANWQQRIRDGKCDDGEMVQAFARHRQAAEKAQQERDAGIAEGLVTLATALRAGRGCNDKVTIGEAWRRVADGAHDIATAIRSQGHE